jgi:hypothetical protein
MRDDTRAAPNAGVLGSGELALLSWGAVVTQVEPCNTGVRAARRQAMDSGRLNVLALVALGGFCDAVSLVVVFSRPRACETLGYRSESFDLQGFDCLLADLLHKSAGGTADETALGAAQARGGRGATARRGPVPHDTFSRRENFRNAECALRVLETPPPPSVASKKRKRL